MNRDASFFGRCLLVRSKGLGDTDPDDPAEIGEMNPLREKFLESTRKLRESKLTVLQAEIIEHLIDGRRTGTELVLEIFQTSKGIPGFDGYYARIRRDLKNLESRGYIATNIFGRDKPYRLTRTGVAMLSSILPEMGAPRIVEKEDVVIFASSIILLFILWLMRRSDEPLYTILFAGFFISIGLALSSFTRILRKVL